jgi:hypothetical protein
MLLGFGSCCLDVVACRNKPQSTTFTVFTSSPLQFTNPPTPSYSLCAAAARHTGHPTGM